MKTNKILAVALVMLAVFLMSCTQSSYDGYATYQQGNQPQGQYVGGGCGVAPMDDYADTPSVDSTQGM